MLRHFDAIDEAVSRRLTRKRPWSEPALTSLLCDLLDEDVQNEEALAYSLEELNKDLAAMDGLFSMSFKIDTHEYDGAVERWITQADLGLIIKCENYLMSSDSWEACWLLQAKRAYPDSRNPPVFSDRSRFAAYDPAQHVRIEQLQQTVGHDFVRYLFYAPRPSALDPTYRAKLAYLRSRRLAEDIFDYTLGLELREELGSPNSTLAGGLWVAPISSFPSNVAALHREVLQPYSPFAWFLVGHFYSRHGVRDQLMQGPAGHPSSRPPRRRPSDTDWACDIVRGERDAITRLIKTMHTDNAGPFPILPTHTMTVRIAVGESLHPDRRFIADE
jgi:hypothetical protein